MDGRSSSVKCAQCGLVSLLTAESCKRCGNALVPPSTGTEQTLNSETQPDETGKPVEKGLSLTFMEKAKVIAAVVIGFVALVVLVFNLDTMKEDQPAQALSRGDLIEPVTLRSQFVEQMKPTMEKFANDIFLVCRDLEEHRLEVESERLSRIMRQSEQSVDSESEKFRTLNSIKPDVLAVQEGLNALKEMLPTKVTAQLAGPDSDILFYNVTGSLARSASHQIVNWWRQESVEQQKMLRDLRRRGFKAVIIGNSTADGQRLELN